MLVTLTPIPTLTLSLTLVLTLVPTLTPILTLTLTLTLALTAPRRWAAAWQRVLPATRAVRNHPVLLVDSAGGGASARSNPSAWQRQSRATSARARRSP